jgi:F-type H+-transporting ATPase subunit delta
MPLTQSPPDALARIYAVSLFELAQAEGGQARIEEVSDELESILGLAQSDFAFGEFLASRILSAEAREESLKKIFSGRISDLTLRFLLVLNKKDRLRHLPSIAAAYDEQVQRAFGRVEVDVYTASEIGPEEVAMIKARLHAVLNKEPVIHTYTEPAMIGGIKMQIGDQLIDASIASGLRKMRDQLNTHGLAEIRSRADDFME